MGQMCKQVAIEYSVFLDDGTLVDSNVGKAPLVYSTGSNQILPELEKAIALMKVGDEKKIILLPSKAYGNLDAKAFKEVDIDSIPEDSRHPGAMLNFRDEKGEEFRVRVHEVGQKTVVLDLNHPLAGQRLTFTVKVLNID